jgi:hypothetical protein
MISKAALVGCAKGPWIPIHGLIKPELDAAGEEGSVFHIEHVEGKSTSVGCGKHPVSEGTFLRVSVVEGDPETALCVILSGGRRVPT